MHTDTAEPPITHTGRWTVPGMGFQGLWASVGRLNAHSMGFVDEKRGYHQGTPVVIADEAQQRCGRPTCTIFPRYPILYHAGVPTHWMDHQKELALYYLDLRLREYPEFTKQK